MGIETVLEGVVVAERGTGLARGFLCRKDAVILASDGGK